MPHAVGEVSVLRDPLELCQQLREMACLVLVEYDEHLRRIHVKGRGRAVGPERMAASSGPGVQGGAAHLKN
ncbi:hypothetical protein [Hymenobacter norwichensis]|uniref:hypothetical protein n=1 Tax=Hymenobacter norwichensis TaxID=223903 RepID=UPI0012F9D203|nr:hypothetical protein [Hymenobacter norwichensis]